MLTRDQIIDDARALVDDLVLDVRIRELSMVDEEEILLEAARIMTTATQIMARMIANRKPTTMH